MEEVRFGDIYKGDFEDWGTDRPLTDLVNMDFYITGVSFYDTANYGEAAVVDVEVPSRQGLSGKYYTFSTVLIKQLKAIKPHLDKGKKVYAVLRRKKRYFTFE